MKKKGLIKGLEKNDYFKFYQKNLALCEFCIHCNVYCTKRDKHYSTDEHLTNISKTFGLNKDLLKKKNKINKKKSN